MARTARIAPGGVIYHVLNRAVGRMKMFRRDEDFQAFVRILIEALERQPLELFSYCLMPSHWHFVVRPEHDGDLSDFFRWLAHTHAMRWRVAHGTVGYGHLYQGRFKSFPVQSDGHLLTVCRYVERNALTAGLVASGRAEAWPWGSLAARRGGAEELQALLAPWPVDRPRDWTGRVNAAWNARELEALRTSVRRDRPFGAEGWTARMARQLGLEHSLRREGRPAKKGDTKAPIK